MIKIVRFIATFFDDYESRQTRVDKVQQNIAVVTADMWCLRWSIRASSSRVRIKVIADVSSFSAMHFRGHTRNAAVRRDRTCCSCNTKDDTRTLFLRRPMCGVEAFSPTIMFPRLARRCLGVTCLVGSSTFLLFYQSMMVRRTAPIMQTRRRVRSFFSYVCTQEKTVARKSPLIIKNTSRESKFSIGFPKNGIS